MEASKKTSKGKVIAIVVVVLLLLGAIGSCSNSGESSSDKSQETQTIKLVAGETGDYGKQLVMSEGTDLEESLIVYYVPGGDYSVKNTGTHAAQVNVYEGVEKNEEGYDEYTDSLKPTLIDPGKSKDITVPDGWFIEIHEPDEIELTLK